MQIIADFTSVDVPERDSHLKYSPTALAATPLSRLVSMQTSEGIDICGNLQDTGEKDKRQSELLSKWKVKLRDHEEGKDKNDDIRYDTKDSTGDTCNRTCICPICKGFRGECRGDRKRLGEKPGIPGQEKDECHNQRDIRSVADKSLDAEDLDVEKKDRSFGSPCGGR